MKLTLESTSKLVQVVDDHGEVPARIWEGHTDTGIPVHCYITRIAVASQADHEQFERELVSVREPSADIKAIPLRLIL